MGTVTLTASSNPTVVGQQETLTATVFPFSSLDHGVVDFRFSSGVLIGTASIQPDGTATTGTASLVFTPDVAGSYFIAADREDSPDSSIIDLTVTPAPGTVPPPTISGSAQEGQTLTAPAIAGQSVSYQWFNNGGAISGATAATYVVQESDEGSPLTVVETATDAGVTTSVASAATTVVTDAAPTVTPPTISGTPYVGQTLTASATAGQADNTLTYAWYSSADNYTHSIGTGPTYLVKAADQGAAIDVVAKVTNEAETSPTWQTQANLAWLPGAAFAPGAQAAAADLVGGKLYVFDGDRNGVASSALSIYDPATNIWTDSATSDVVARSDLASAEDLNKNIYLIGGLVDGAPTNIVSVYDPWTGAVTRIEDYFTPVAGAGAATLPDGRILVIGGRSSTGTLNQVGIVDPATGTTTSLGTFGALPVAVSDPAVVAVGDKVVVYGGLTGTTASTATTAVQIFDPETHLWSLLTPMPTARYGATAGVLPDGAVLVAGGFDSSGQALSTTQVFTFGSSTSGPAMPVSDAFMGQGLIADGTQMVVMGGTNGSIFERLTYVTPGTAQSVSATSAPTGPVTLAPTVTTPTISGIAQEGQTLTAAATAGPGDTLSFQWLDNGSAIAGATEATYLVQESDEGHTLAVAATATDPVLGGTAAATSAPSGPVLDADPTVTALTISGVAQEGQTLTALATPADSDNAVVYEWFSSANGYKIPIGTHAAYVVQEADEGYTLEVKAFVTNENGVSTTATTTTGPVTDADPIITALMISGVAQEGQTLTALATPADSDNAVVYEWFSSANGYKIPIGTHATYVVQEADEGYTLEVKAFVTNENGVSTTATTTTGPVLDADPTVTALTISGTAQEGQTLTATATPGDSDNAVTYAWFSSTDKYTTQIGANADYQVQEGDEGNTLEVVATVTNENGVSTTATSTTGPVGDADPTVTALMISGVAQEGQTLTALATPADSDNAVVYEWFSSANGYKIPIGTHAAYVMQEADEGYTLEVKAFVTNENGVSTTATTTIGPVTDAAPTLSVLVTGKAIAGQTLTAVPTIGTDADGGAIRYQWQYATDGAHWSNIAANANASTYLVQQGDGGHQLRVEATFTDDTHQTVTADSTATAPVIAVTVNPERLVISEGTEFLPITSWLLANDSSPSGRMHVTSVDGHTWGMVSLAPGYTALLMPDGRGGDLVYLGIDDGVVARNATIAPDVSFTYTASDGVFSASATDTIAAVNVGRGGIDLTSGAIGRYDFSLVAGADGSETLKGGAGVDVLIGGDGRNTIVGGAGGDLLVADGPTVFKYNAVTDSTPGHAGNLNNFDTVLLFDPNADRFDFSAISGITAVTTRPLASAGATVAPHSVAWLFDRSDNQTILYANASGQAEQAGATDMEIHLAGQVGLTASDFITAGGKQAVASADPVPAGVTAALAPFAAAQVAGLLLFDNGAANLAPAGNFLGPLAIDDLRPSPALSLGRT